MPLAELLRRGFWVRIPRVAEMYSTLSEYAHLNWLDALFLYRVLDTESRCLSLQ